MEHVPAQMDLDEEERECFGNLLGKRALALGMESPNKYPHPSGKGVPPQGGNRQRPPPTTAWFPPGGPLSGEPHQRGAPRKIGDFFRPVAAQGGQGAHSPVGLPVTPPKRSHGHLHLSEWRRPSADGAATPRSDGQLARPAQQGQSHQIPQADSAPVRDVGNHHQGYHVCRRQD